MVGTVLDVHALAMVQVNVVMEHVAYGQKPMRIVQMIVLLIGFLELILVQKSGLAMVNVMMYFPIFLQVVI